MVPEGRWRAVETHIIVIRLGSSRAFASCQVAMRRVHGGGNPYFSVACSLCPAICGIWRRKKLLPAARDTPAERFWHPAVRAAIRQAPSQRRISSSAPVQRSVRALRRGIDPNGPSARKQTMEDQVNGPFGDDLIDRVADRSDIDLVCMVCEVPEHGQTNLPVGKRKSH